MSRYPFVLIDQNERRDVEAQGYLLIDDLQEDANDIFVVRFKMVSGSYDGSIKYNHLNNLHLHIGTGKRILSFAVLHGYIHNSEEPRENTGSMKHFLDETQVPWEFTFELQPLTTVSAYEASLVPDQHVTTTRLDKILGGLTIESLSRRLSLRRLSSTTRSLPPLVQVLEDGS